MDPQRDGYHHGDLPRALLDASVALVAEHGVDAFSLRAAARAVGVNPSAVYRHFADRSVLLGAVAVTGFEELRVRMARALERADEPPARFQAAGEAYVRFALDQPERFRVMFGPYGSSPGSPARRHLEAGYPDRVGPYGLLVGVVEDLGRSTGGLDLADAALTAWSAVHGLATLLVDHAVELDPARVDAAIMHLTRTVLRGLGGDEAAGDR